MPGRADQALDDRREDVHRRGTAERRLTLDGGVERAAESPDVTGRPAGVALRAFGRQVSGRSDDLAGTGEPRVALADGDPEVGQPSLPVGGDDDVARLDVAMYHAEPVRRVQRVGQGDPDLGDPLDGQAAVALDQGRQRVPLDELHHDPGQLAVVDDIEYPDRAWVVDPPGGTCLPQHPFPGLRDGHPGAGGQPDLLDGDSPAHDLVGGAVHHPHPALADHLVEPVAPAHDGPGGEDRWSAGSRR